MQATSTAIYVDVVVQYRISTFAVGIILAAICHTVHHMDVLQQQDEVDKASSRMHKSPKDSMSIPAYQCVAKLS